MTKSLEDYVEAIYRLSKESGRARVVDVAAMLHVKMPSVNNAVKELARLKLVKYEKYRELMLTEEGEAVARKVYEHHLLLKGFLISLGVSEENAENDACAMEHILSAETIECFRRATNAKVFTRCPPDDAPRALVVATHNRNKLREIGEILPGWEIKGEDSGAEETADTFAGNALIKARAVASRHPGSWVLADDSGLEVDALGGAPGVFSARYAGRDGDTPANNALLLRNLAGAGNRKAHFTCVIALVAPDGSERLFEGRCEGRIAEKPSGEGGFGYDPLFIPDGHDKSFASLSAAEKNAISHRGRALAALRAALVK